MKQSIKNKIKKVSTMLNKASKAHAGQSKVLKGLLKNDKEKNKK